VVDHFRAAGQLGQAGRVGRVRGAAEPAIDVLKELLTTWSAAHDVVLADPDQACEILWGTLYGIASLSYLGNVGSDRARRLAEQALRAILLGWQTEALANG
jgi:hypothetical protein